MTKRYSNYDLKNNKKPKLDDDIDALWGEDLDEDAIADCIKLATQVYEEDRITCTQLNNVTLLPTYSAFKERSVIISSTQYNSSIQPSTSKNEQFRNNITVGEGLEREIKLLRQQYEEKEGEVAVLRTLLHDTKMNIQTEQQKAQNEWKEKLNTSEKQMKTIKSELEFKNLEIGNLKQKILNITKHSNLNITLNSTQNLVNQKIKKEKPVAVDTENKKKSTKIQAILQPVYPLKEAIPDFILNIPKREQHIIETKLTNARKNAIPYLQNQTISATIAVDKSEVNVDYVFPEMLKLMYCTEEELNSDKNNIIVSKIVCTCEQTLHDLQAFLDQIKNNLRTEDILEADTNYLKHQKSKILETDKDQIGIKSWLLLNFVAQLIPYNDLLKNYVCQNKDLPIPEKESYVKKFPYLANKKRKFEQHYFLNMLLIIVRTAGEIRKANVMSGFLCSTIKLLINIVKSRNFDYASDIFCKLTKEIILSRPTAKVICEITFLFKIASHHSSFIEFLFNKSKNSATSKKGILHFNEDACRFYIFVMLFENNIFNVKSEHFSVNVCLNLLCFIYNMFRTCNWIFHRDAIECECVLHLYKLEVEIVFRALEKYVEEVKRTKKRSSDWDHFFKNAITVKVLSLMTFNALELTGKYITVLSQYEEIEKTLQEENLRELVKLNINEEVVEVSSSAFASIDF